MIHNTSQYKVLLYRPTLAVILMSNYAPPTDMIIPSHSLAPIFQFDYNTHYSRSCPVWPQHIMQQTTRHEKIWIGWLCSRIMGLIIADYMTVGITTVWTINPCSHSMRKVSMFWIFSLVESIFLLANKWHKFSRVGLQQSGKYKISLSGHLVICSPFCSKTLECLTSSKLKVEWHKVLNYSQYILQLYGITCACINFRTKGSLEF